MWPAWEACNVWDFLPDEAMPFMVTAVSALGSDAFSTGDTEVFSATVNPAFTT
jgi:hypothetical protein